MASSVSEVKRQPVRMIAGAPVKHAPVVVSVEPLLSELGEVCDGAWIETRSDGSRIIVTDLTSALWKFSQ